MFLLDDGAVTKIDLGKKYVDGSVLLTSDIYGDAIPEGVKENIYKYKFTDFYEELEKFTLKYSAQSIEDNGFVWIDFPYNESLMHDVSVEMLKEGPEQYLNMMGCIKGIMYDNEATAKTVLLSVQQMEG